MLRRLALIPLLLSGCVGYLSPSGGVQPWDSADPTDTGETGEVEPPEVMDLQLTQHEEVATILELSWAQVGQAELGWVEYRFEGEDWMSSPALAREVGGQREVLLGIPAERTVEARLVLQVGDQTVTSEIVTGVTGSLPSDLIVPEMLLWDPVIASEHPWLLGSVDVGSYWYGGPCYSFILDRQGRVVWYHKTPSSRLNIFTQPSADGSHLLIEGTTYYTWGQDIEPIIDRLTLDKRIQQRLDLPDLGLSFDEIPGGSILYNAHREHDLLIELYPDGSERELFDCDEFAQQVGFSPSLCLVNAVVYNEAQGSVFWSMFQNDSVVEIDYATGELIRYFGQLPGGWDIDPPEAVNDYQHYPNYTPDGTIIFSTHAMGERRVQYAREYRVDEADQRLEVIWEHREDTDYYAEYGGEAFRLDNGNTFLCYGTDGAVREITSGGEIAWELAWPADPNTHLLGHFTYLDELYPLNEGPEDASEATAR
jgi:hypothetical protein